MKTNESITLSRDCVAIQIPSGEKAMLPAGTQVKIMQSLGGTYTVTTDQGNLVRISGKDGDAIGMEVVEASQTEVSAITEETDLVKLVWDQLKTLYDPEIPVNIVDLGLIYACRVNPLPTEGNKVEVEMTLTAPGCGMGNVLKAEAEDKIRRLPGVKEVDIKVVFDPPWDPSRMSEAAKLELGWM